MGVVYLGYDGRLDRQVAIKALPEDLGAQAERLQRFEIEAKALAQVNHANIAQIHGVEEVEGQKYLILEYVDAIYRQSHSATIPWPQGTSRDSWR